MSYRVLTLGFLSLFSLAVSALKFGEGVYHLSYGSALGPNHTFSQADQDWIKHVETVSEGRIKIDAYWSGSLISSEQNVLELRHGLTDIAMITPIYMRAGMHATRVQTGFYAGAEAIDTQVQVFHCLLRDFPIFQEELEGLKILVVQGGTPSYVLTRDQPINKLEDFRGLRLRAPTALVPVVYELGGDPVLIPMGDVYSAFAKGVIDGVLTPEDTLRSMHFAEIGKYLNRIAMHRGGYPSRAISERAWQQLPKDLQTILWESGRYWEQRIAHYIVMGNDAAVTYGKEQGIEFVPLPAAEQDRFNALYQQVAKKDAKSLERFNIDGEAIFDYVGALIKEINAGAEVDCRGSP